MITSYFPSDLWDKVAEEVLHSDGRNATEIHNTKNRDWFSLSNQSLIHILWCSLSSFFLFCF